MNKGWTKGQKEKFRATMKRKKLEREQANVANKLSPPEQAARQMTPSVDVERIHERGYRHGLLDAVQCIIRELR